jgi:RNA polymerase sigma-70 factor (ECF subfamily)
MIERALMRLPIEQREAFVLREYFGYSYEEIAGITKSAMVTAKTRAWRARERLRKMIGAWLELKQ